MLHFSSRMAPSMALARWESVAQRKTSCFGPANMGPVTGWFVSVSCSLWSPARAVITVSPSGRPLTTPSSSAPPERDTKSRVTLRVPAHTLTSCSCTPSGTVMTRRASPPETYSAGLEATSMLRPWLPGTWPNATPSSATTITSQDDVEERTRLPDGIIRNPSNNWIFRGGQYIRLPRGPPWPSWRHRAAPVHEQGRNVQLCCLGDAGRSAGLDRYPHFRRHGCAHRPAQGLRPDRRAGPGLRHGHRRGLHPRRHRGRAATHQLHGRGAPVGGRRHRAGRLL